jgi:hypothetical protein
MIRAAQLALVVFAATMGADLPRPPVNAHAAWADLALVFAAAFAGLALLRRQLSLRVTWVPPIVAYVAWIAICAWNADGDVHARVAWVVGAAALAALAGVTALVASAEQAREQLARAWIYGALLLGVIGIAAGVAAQLGIDITPLHRGDGELGLRFRPAGLQRVGLIAELSLVPFLFVVHDGERLLGRRMRILAIVVLSIVLLVGMTRTLLAVAFGVALLRLRSRKARVAAALLLAALAFGAARFDVHGTATPGIRWRIAASALKQASAHPLFGIGPERDVAITGWPRASDPPVGWDAHDTLLDLAARAGVPAAALFVWIFALALRRARGAVDPFGVALYVGLLATAFDSFSVDLEHFRHVWLLFGLVLASREAA